MLCLQDETGRFDKAMFAKILVSAGEPAGLIVDALDQAEAA
ncbi:hypothetical protein [Streptosporangium canum]